MFSVITRRSVVWMFQRILGRDYANEMRSVHLYITFTPSANIALRSMLMKLFGVLVSPLFFLNLPRYIIKRILPILHGIYVLGSDTRSTSHQLNRHINATVMVTAVTHTRETRRNLFAQGN